MRSCDLPFEKVASDKFINDELNAGEKVEIEISPRIWVPGTVIHDMETRVSVTLDTPLLWVREVTTRIVREPVGLLSLFLKPIITETVELQDTYSTTWTAGRWYVRRPEGRRA